MSEVEAMRDVLRSLVNRDGPQPTLEETRAAYEAWGLSNPLPDGGTVTPTSLGGVAALTTQTPGARADAALLYLHGGGYAIGSASGHRHVCAHLAAQAGITGYAIDYRLAPEHPYPAAVEDAVAAYAALLAQGVAPSRIVIAGDSAGGGLTLATALAVRERGMPQPAGLFCISPWADLTQTGQSYRVCAERDLLVTKTALDAWTVLYAGERDPAQPLISPAFADYAGLAPILIHVGADEVLLSDSLKVAEAAGLANVPVELVIEKDMQHVWHFMLGMLTQARVSIAAAGAWMRARVG
ncbi:MAG: alpha/beta hydrolase [Alphaproteobacteria bacterium]|nr:alpha/beta hydrolase [Alphaproteobacteria bacterium]